jgi:hypothetical protein
MNINEEVQKLPSVGRAFYDGQVRPGDSYELLQRKQALTIGLIDNDPAITSNRNAAEEIALASSLRTQILEQRPDMTLPAIEGEVVSVSD